MSNVVSFTGNDAESIKNRITELINNIPERSNRSVVIALLIALGDFIETIDCPKCRAFAVEQAVGVAADIRECFGPASSGPSNHAH